LNWQNLLSIGIVASAALWLTQRAVKTFRSIGDGKPLGNCGNCTQQRDSPNSTALVPLSKLQIKKKQPRGKQRDE
jgi:hypothetical protein